MGAADRCLYGSVVADNGVLSVCAFGTVESSMDGMVYSGCWDTMSSVMVRCPYGVAAGVGIWVDEEPGVDGV